MLYRRKNSPHWWIGFAIGGRRTRVSSGTENRQEAQELHDRLKSETWRQVGLEERPKYLWAEAAGKWLDDKNHKASIDDDRIHLRFIQHHFKGRRLESIDKNAI